MINQAEKVILGAMFMCMCIIFANVFIIARIQDKLYQQNIYKYEQYQEICQNKIINALQNK